MQRSCDYAERELEDKWKRRRRKEKEEETKEDGFPHPSQEELGPSIRFHRARSKGRDQAEGEEEGQKGSQANQEQEKGKFVIGRKQQLQLESRELRGGRQGFVRTCHSIDSAGLETMPGSAHDEYDRRSKGSTPQSDWHSRGTYGWSGAGHCHPVRAANPDAQHEWSSGSGVAPLGTPVGSIVDWSSGGCSGSGCTTPQGIGGSRQGHEARALETTIDLMAQERPSLSSTTEIMKAGRQANEEQKVLQKASLREGQERGKGQWTDWRVKGEKGDKGGKADKGKKGKGEGKKKAA